MRFLSVRRFTKSLIFASNFACSLRWDKMRPPEEFGFVVNPAEVEIEGVSAKRRNEESFAEIQGTI